MGALKLGFKINGEKNMKKTLSMIATLVSSSILHAGAMSSVPTKPALVPYVMGEASYTNIQIATISLNELSVSATKQNWGGRLSAGFVYPVSEKFRFINEIGGGYYGDIKKKVGNANSSKNSIDGYDVLAGGLYRLRSFDSRYLSGDLDLLAQIGFMLENCRNQLSADLGTLNVGNALHGRTNSKNSVTQALPEIKVGGVYQFNSNWGLSVAYLHVFGADRNMSQNTKFNILSGMTIDVNANLQNPTLDSVMFGLRYSFA